MHDNLHEKGFRPFVIGITGGMGAGKTTFAKALAQCGCQYLDVDALAHELVDSSSEIKNAIKTTFGDTFFDAQDRLNRERFGSLVFSDVSLLNALNQIVWPFLSQTVRNQVKQLSNSGIPIVLDMAVLYETGCDTLCDYIIAVDAPLEMRIERLMRSRNWTKEEAERRIRFQNFILKNLEKANRIIWNVDSIEQLNHVAEEIYFELFPNRRGLHEIPKRS